MVEHLPEALLWGLIGSGLMITVLQGCMQLRISRLNFPFLVGTFITGHRHRAMFWGLGLYLIGGWLFALLYFALFAAVGYGSWWFGALVGLLHGLFLITVALPLFPHIHPRMAASADGPNSRRRMEPPGPFALNYGRQTPLSTLAAQVVYGATLGFGWGFIG